MITSLFLLTDVFDGLFSHMVTYLWTLFLFLDYAPFCFIISFAFIAFTATHPTTSPLMTSIPDIADYTLVAAAVLRTRVPGVACGVVFLCPEGDAYLAEGMQVRFIARRRRELQSGTLHLQRIRRVERHLVAFGVLGDDNEEDEALASIHNVILPLHWTIWRLFHYFSLSSSRISYHDLV